MSVDHLNYLLLEEVFSGESFCWFSQSVSCVVAKSLNGDLYSCARGMILQTENSLLHSLSRPDLLFVIFNSVMTVLNDVTTKYRLMREEAAYANHNVVVWYLLECRCSLLDERSVLTTPNGLRVTFQSKTWRTAINLEFTKRSMFHPALRDPELTAIYARYVRMGMSRS